MQVNLIKIGTSRGIRLPKAILAACGAEEGFELEVRERNIILHPLPRRPREGWAEAFDAMHEAGDDKLLWPEQVENSFGNDEWFW